MAEQRTSFTAADCLRIEDLQHLYTRQQAAAEVFRARLSRVVLLEAPDFSQGVYTAAYPTLFNVLEDNLRRLYYGYQAEGLEEARFWQGVERDKPRLSAQDANRWFQTLVLLMETVEMICARVPVTNMCKAGGDRTRQWIRAV